MSIVTLMGMSGVGKTMLAQKIPKDKWFHYSVDYRIGTRYLGEEINDSLIAQAMQVPHLAELLRNDSIYIGSNISFNNLAPLSKWVGKVGNPDLGGLPLAEFKRRQALHHQAEIKALLDISKFHQRAVNLYGYHNFLIDAGGSLIEVIDVDNPNSDPIISMLKELNAQAIYIEATAELYRTLVQRSIASPKPMYYNPEFFDQSMDLFLSETGIAHADKVVPDDFVRWVIPRCADFRAERYERLLKSFGKKISSEQAAQISCTDDLFL